MGNFQLGAQARALNSNGVLPGVQDRADRGGQEPSHPALEKLTVDPRGCKVGRAQVFVAGLGQRTVPVGIGFGRGELG